MLFFLPLSLPYVNWASQESCLFHLRFSLRSSELPLFYLFYFWGIFPSLSFSQHYSGPFFFFFFLDSNYLTLPTKRWEAQFFENRAVEISLAISCWTGMVRGIGPPPLASLKPQSPYNSVHLRVSDIFHGWLWFYISLLNWHCML